jgi:hypothetical protein
MSYTDRDRYGMYKTSSSQGPGPALMGADTLIGDSVVNGQEEDLGDIKEIMIDMRSGQVAYAVLSFGGFLGIGSHVYPIPWEMLTYDEDRHGYIADVTAETVRKAPSMALDETDRPREMEGEMYAYWDVNPYW